MALRPQVIQEYDINNEITHRMLCDMFPNANEKTLLGYLSEARNPNRKIRDQPVKKIDLDQIESRIIAIINKQPSAANMKLALDFIRLKQSTEGLQDEIDIEQYLVKTLAIIKCQDKVDIPIIPRDKTIDGEIPAASLIESEKPTNKDHMAPGSIPLIITNCQGEVDKVLPNNE